MGVGNCRSPGGVGGGVLASASPQKITSCEVATEANGGRLTGEARRRVDAKSPEIRASMLKSDTVTLERSRRDRCTSVLPIAKRLMTSRKFCVAALLETGSDYSGRPTSMK